MVQDLTDLPICIDSSVVEALEAGLSAYEGRALVNSVTAEDDRLAAILPLVKKYDAAIIALPNDHDEIPMEADKRLDLTAKIIRVATEEYGIDHRRHRDRPARDADRCRHLHPLVTWETMRRIRDGFGVNMTCGASNISFGMPDRHTVDAAWLPMAMTAGLTSAIMDARTPQIVDAVKAATCSWTTTSGARPGSPRPAAKAAVERAVTDGVPAHLIAPVRSLDATEPPPADGTGRVGSLHHRRPPRPGGPCPARCRRLRRGELARHRDRLDLWRARHLQEVQGAGGAVRTSPCPDSTNARSRRRSSRPAGGWRAWPRPAPTSRSRCRR